MRTELRTIAVVLVLGAGPGLAGDDPLSAIDWLSKSVTTPAGSAVGKAAKTKPRNETPVSSAGGLPQSVATSTLDGPQPDAVGLLSSAVTGLPRDIWGMGLETEISAAITAGRSDPLPALQGLLMTILLAEAAAPADADGKGTLALARIDKLLAMGALDQAAAMLDLLGPSQPENFRRAFDVALLIGDEDKGCEMMRATPNLAPTFPARIFCLARAGDWNAAALTLRTGQALGYVTPEEDELLSRFLDPDLYEGERLPALPATMTPLSWRMFEAIGEPQPTASLPLAFAHADLRDAAGWKAQIEAAERLTRAGAIAPNQLLGLYTERQAAASGGVWDRVDAFQRFDSALSARDEAMVSQSLPPLWDAMTEAELEVPFAILFAARLAQLPLKDEAGRIAFQVGMLSPQYETIARARSPESPREAFLIGLATGNLTGAAPQDSLGRAITPAFRHATLAPDFAALMEQRRLGEAILLAIDKVGRGVQGDLSGVTEGLGFLRHAGLEDAARRTALELMLLERRG